MAFITCPECKLDLPGECFTKEQGIFTKVFDKCIDCRRKAYEHGQRGCDVKGCTRDGTVYTLKCGCRTHIACLDKTLVGGEGSRRKYNCSCGKKMLIVNDAKFSSWKLM